MRCLVEERPRTLPDGWREPLNATHDARQRRSKCLRPFAKTAPANPVAAASMRVAKATLVESDVERHET